MSFSAPPSSRSSPEAPLSTVVGNWMLNGHSFAPKREYFIKHCKSLSKRRIVDNLLRFDFAPPHNGESVSIHYSRLAFVGGPLAALLDEPADDEKIDVDTGERLPIKENGAKPDALAVDPAPNGNDALEGDANQTADDKDVDMEKEKEDRTAVTADKDVQMNTDKPTTVKLEKDTSEELKVMDVDENAGNTAGDKPDVDKPDSDKPDTDKPQGDKTDADSASPEKNADVTKKPDGKEVEEKPEKKQVTVEHPFRPRSRIYIKQEYMLHKSPVQLNSEDTPRTFYVITQYLYCEEILFNYLTFDEIVHLANAAHRWDLQDLYSATFSYVQQQDLLAGGLGIRTFIPLVRHPDAPESFRRYFCTSVGHSFSILYPRLKARKATEATSPGTKSTPPPIWDVAIQQNMLSHLIHCISLYSKQCYDSYLLDVILRYYEPKKDKTDDDILAILSQLNWDEIDPSSIFDSEGPCQNWSARAIRLAALASYAPQTESLEVRIPWNIPLQKLLKDETWSFQTEHVMCGPYVCYLHVRKGAGPEVSLFVHIWYRDGKPIGDEARHKAVRVKCRATERNCHCDSSKQWSDASHGFLENLKFEGKLNGYPGLGWSQFLEEKRLEEWRSSHGENCGLAITTVLQFVQPKKQFEGPARRAIPSSSPMRLASPIQKRRPASRMKLRETR